ncbi:hypothetical protein O181_093856 [Austropuccinia psidii MF-1]|uniref:Retrotransposon gag domain-containing protein n=1 Tax=Austropuccinia psidii MF-1 TaxID=1389203 RepID=A0A9Q3J241_9BASI|nr:hypothetical protein [Austropuccinia psidii MF-1]
MAPKSNGYFTLSLGHQGTSSRQLTRLNKKIFNLKIPMTPSSHHWLFLTHSIPPRQYWKLILRGYSRGRSKNNLSSVSAPSIHLGNHIHSIQSGFINNGTSFIHHGNFIQPSSFTNLARHTLHQAVNTALRIQYKPSRNSIIYYYFLYSIGVFQVSSLISECQTWDSRAPLDGIQALPQLRAKLDRGPILEGEEPSRKEGRGPRRSNSFSGLVGGLPGTSRTIFRGPGEDGEEEEENSVEEEESDGTEGVPAPVGASQGTGGPTLAQSNQPFSHQSEPSLLAIMQKMTQIMANLQAASSSEASRPPAFKTPSMKAPECFDGTQPFKVRSFIQSCQLIFHNDLANFSQDRKKVLYATSFLIGRAEKWIEPYLSNLTNQDSNYLLNSWPLFESQLLTLFCDPNKVRKAEAELDSLRMKEVGHVSLYIADFRSLVSRIVDWGERALIHHFRKGLPSRILDQLASHP